MNFLLRRPCRNALLQLGITLLLVGSLEQAEARNFRVAMLPNGGVNNCLTCHNSSNGGSRNSFGLAVQARVTPNGTQAFWDAALAGQDSDGDGFTNGQELGDPDGDFQNVGSGSLVTNPGNSSSRPNRSPGFNSSPGTTASVGVLYSYQASGIDPDGDSLTFSKVSGPTWLNVTTGGLVSGTPPTGSAGSHPVTLRVTDNASSPLSADQSYNITVSAPNQQPAFTSSPVTGATEGVAYSYQATASDPDSNPLTFSKVTGPAWISVSGAGAVTGTPPAGSAGSVVITIRVTDNGSPALLADQSFNLAVSAAFASWQTQNFNLPAENAIAAPNMDPDNDGLPNLVEYALKTAPKQATAVTLMSNRTFNGNGQLQFSQVFRDDDPKLSVKYEAAAAVPLANPTVINAVLTDPAPGDGLKTWTFTDSVSKNNTATRFGRLRFELLP